VKLNCLVFRKEDGDWRAFPHDGRDQKCLSSLTAQFPSAINWTRAFDGRNIGQVRTTNPERYDFYRDVGQQKITGTESIPTIGKASQDFAGFLNGPVHRPLIAISKSHLTDPEQWKPAQLSPEFVSLLRKQFRQKFPKVSQWYELRGEHREAVALPRQRHQNRQNVFLERALVGCSGATRGISVRRPSGRTFR
jgi:hypothetical protein